MRIYQYRKIKHFNIGAKSRESLSYPGPEPAKPDTWTSPAPLYYPLQAIHQPGILGTFLSFCTNPIFHAALRVLDALFAQAKVDHRRPRTLGAISLGPWLLTLVPK